MQVLYQVQLLSGSPKPETLKPEDLTVSVCGRHVFLGAQASLESTTLNPKRIYPEALASLGIVFNFLLQ